jgi:MFS family permease
MSERGVWSANLVALLVGVSMYGSFAFLPQFNQTPTANGYGFGATVTESAHMMVPSSVVSFCCGLYAARLAARIGMRRTLVQSSVITGAALVLVAFVHDKVWQVIVATCLSGLGSGVVFANLANAIVGAVRPEQTGTAIGMNANIRIIGGAVGSAITVTIVTADLLPSGYPTERGYVLGFLFLALSCFVAAVAAVLIPKKGRQRPSPELPHGTTLAEVSRRG